MSPAVEVLFGLVVLVSLCLVALAYHSYRRWDQLGIEWLAIHIALIGIGGIGAGLYALVVGPGEETLQNPLWGQIALLAWVAASVPWLMSALQYTGRYTQINGYLVVLLYLPLSVIVTTIVLEAGFVGPEPNLVNAFASMSFVFYLAVVLVGSFILGRATYADPRIPFEYGLALAIAPLILISMLNVNAIFQDVSVLLSTSMYTLAQTLTAVAIAGAVLYGGVLERTPAVETVGKRFALQETDDLVLVTDTEDRVVTCNEAVTETLDRPREAVLNAPVSETLGHDTDSLASGDTVTLTANGGTRRYDCQVSPVVDDTGVELGAALSLRDVTDRELREQRLAVLNRVLRHNLRNKVDVVRSHAEVLESRETGDSEHVATIADQMDELAALGSSARTIDRFLSASTERARVDLTAALRETLAAPEAHGVSLSLDAPETAPVETNRRALDAALESAIDNAVTYADTAIECTVVEHDGAYELRITDDGSGIPDSEIEALDEGTETPLQHGTGLGLWQLKWAVTTIGGELDIATDDGTTISFTVPKQGAGNAVEGDVPDRTVTDG